MKVWNVICPVCGFRYKSYELKLRWDGVYVCLKDWETRNIVEFYRARSEDTSVPYSYPSVDGTTEDTSDWVDTLTPVSTPRTDTL